MVVYKNKTLLVKCTQCDKKFYTRPGCQTRTCSTACRSALMRSRCGNIKDPCLSAAELERYLQLLTALESARPDQRARIQQEMLSITNLLREA